MANVSNSILGRIPGVCVLKILSNGQRRIRHTQRHSEPVKAQIEGDYRRIYLIGQASFPQVGGTKCTPACALASQIRSGDGYAHGKSAARKLTHQSIRSEVKPNANTAIRGKKITTMLGQNVSLNCK